MGSQLYLLNKTHQGSGELPWLAIFCILSHITARRSKCCPWFQREKTTGSSIPGTLLESIPCFSLPLAHFNMYPIIIINQSQEYDNFHIVLLANYQTWEQSWETPNSAAGVRNEGSLVNGNPYFGMFLQ